MLDYYSESEFEIWFYYIITKYSEPEIRKQELDYYLSQAVIEKFSTEPIILSFFVRNNFSINKKIFDRLKNEYCLNVDSLKNKSHDESLPLQGIAMSRWWIVLLALFIYIRRTEKKSGRKPKGFKSFRDEITPYFYQNEKGDLNYSEMGIFCELL